MSDKKLYAYRTVANFKLTNGNIFTTETTTKLTYLTEPEIQRIAKSTEKYWDASKFSEVLEAARKKEFPEVHYQERKLTKMKVLSMPGSFGDYWILRERDFENVRLYIEYWECNPSIKTVADMLDAKTFLEFCRDNSVVVGIDLSSN